MLKLNKTPRMKESAETSRWYMEIASAVNQLVDGVALKGANSDITSLIGNLTGIKFAPTQVPSADANTLDDYEEGTWSPVLSQTGMTFTQSNSGAYTKVGNLVTVSFLINITSASGTPSSQPTIATLPFAASKHGSTALREHAVGGFAWTCSLNTGASALLLVRYDNSSTVSSGMSWHGSLSYMV